MVSAQPVPCFLRMCGTCLQLEACTWISKSLLCVLSSILPPVIQRHFQPFGAFACTIWVFESLLSCSLHLRSCSWKPLFVRSCVLLVRFCFCNLFLRFGSVLLLLGTCLPAHKQKSETGPHAVLFNDFNAVCHSCWRRLQVASQTFRGDRKVLRRRKAKIGCVRRPILHPWSKPDHAAF